MTVQTNRLESGNDKVIVVPGAGCAVHVPVRFPSCAGVEEGVLTVTAGAALVGAVGDATAPVVAEGCSTFSSCLRLEFRTYLGSG